MNAQDIFELQQSAALEDWILNSALDKLADDVPLSKLENAELSALADRCRFLLLDRDVIDGVVVELF